MLQGLKIWFSSENLFEKKHLLEALRSFILYGKFENMVYPINMKLVSRWFKITFANISCNNNTNNEHCHTCLPLVSSFLHFEPLSELFVYDVFLIFQEGNSPDIRRSTATTTAATIASYPSSRITSIMPNTTAHSTKIVNACCGYRHRESDIWESRTNRWKSVEANSNGKNYDLHTTHLH